MDDGLESRPLKVAFSSMLDPLCCGWLFLLRVLDTLFFLFSDTPTHELFYDTAGISPFLKAYCAKVSPHFFIDRKIGSGVPFLHAAHI